MRGKKFIAQILTGFTILCLLVLTIFVGVESQTEVAWNSHIPRYERLRPVTVMLDNVEAGMTEESRLFKKFVGEDYSAPAGRPLREPPTIADFSYAGYKQGEEAIPDFVGGTIINVRDYGAIPNDNIEDTQAIQDAFNAVSSSYTVVYFPPGQYDVFMGRTLSMQLPTIDHVVVQGSGAQGSEHGGTTIKQHNTKPGVSRSDGIFSVKRKQDPNISSQIHEIGSPTGFQDNYITVTHPNKFAGHKYIVIGSGRSNNHYARVVANTGMLPSDFPEEWTDIHSAIQVHDYHEIDRIDYFLKRIYLKGKLMGVYSVGNQVKVRKYTEGIGFQDLHIDCGFDETWDHDRKDEDEFKGRGAIRLTHTAHSWVKHVRISNFTSAIEYSGSIYATIIGVILDGKSGHYSVVGDGAGHAFIALVDEHTSNRAHHGISVQGRTTGIVAWGIGGPDGYLNGPDTHGWQCAHTLYDNYHSVYHQTSGTAINNRPNHLNGYIRYNNGVRSSAPVFDGWWYPDQLDFNDDGVMALDRAIQYFFEDITNVAGSNLDFSESYLLNQVGGFQVTQGIISGYRTSSHLQDFKFHEGRQAYVSPASLYIGQLEHRLGYIPNWVEKEKSEYEDFFNVVYGYILPSANPIILDHNAPSFDDGDKVSFTLQENIPINSNVGNRLLVTDDYSKTFTYEITEAYQLVDNVKETIDINFSIDNTGQIKSKSRHDYETETLKIQYLSVKVNDNMGKFDTIEVEIYISNLNEEPVFQDNNTRNRIWRDVVRGVSTVQVLGDPVVAIDPEGQSIRYTLTGENSGNLSIDVDTGQITTTGIIDHANPEVKAIMSGIHVVATDSALSSSYIGLALRLVTPEETPVPINELEDRSNNDDDDNQEYPEDIIPYFTNHNQAYISVAFSDTVQTNFSIEENSLIGTSVGEPFEIHTTSTLTELVYTLTGNGNEHFEIDDTGQLKVAGHIDYESQRTYTFRVTVSDGSTHDTLDILIRVIDQNGDLLQNRSSTVIQGILNTFPNIDDPTLVTKQMIREITGRVDIGGALRSPIVFENPDNPFREGDLDNLIECKEIVLRYTNIKTLPNHFFSDLHKMTWLILSDNDIETLPSGVFSGLDTVRDLYLNDNELTELPETLFDDMRLLRSVKLNRNKLEELPQGIFSSNSKLEQIDLSNNNLTSITTEMFSDVKSLKNLHLDYNDFQTLPYDLLHSHSDLNSLGLSYTSIRQLPDRFFEDVSRLESLDLSGNVEINTNDPRWSWTELPTMPLKVKIENPRDNRIQVVIPTGAPFDMTFNLHTSTGILNRNGVVTIRRGDIESSTLRLRNTEGEIQLSFAGSMPDIPSGHKGYHIEVDESMPLVIPDISAPMSMRLMPESSLVFNNYPNPFNPETWIPYQLSEDSWVTLTIYDVKGTSIRTIDLGIQSAGFYKDKRKAIHWDGKNSSGEQVSTGVYFYHLKINKNVYTNKMLILK